MQGEYIVDRLLPGFVADACENLSVACARFSDDWVIRIDGNGKRRWVVGYTFDLNGAGSVGVASDKVATSLTLESEGIPATEHFLVRTHAEQDLLLDNLTELDAEKPVVIKPLSGSGGRGVRLMPNKAAALEFIGASTHPNWALSPHYDVVSEKRVIMLDGQVLCAYDKTQPYDQEGLKMFNLGLGAVAVNCELSADELTLAERALAASSLRIAAVDIARLSDGSPIIMEINSGITMEHYARQSEEYLKMAANVYQRIIEAMMLDD
jgi:glutathione synthase/RimK-type ligase-like ATP-grasp enzyme